VRRILLTAGVWENQTSREISEIREKHPDWDNTRISKELHISRQTVSLYTPYSIDEDVSVDEKNDIIADKGECGEDAHWTLTESGKLVISGFGPMRDYNGDLRGVWKSPRPEWWHRKDNIKVTEIEIEDGIKTIGEYAFADLKSLKKITIPDSVEAINGGALLGINYLKEIRIPDKVSVISWDMFYYCIYLESLYIPAGIEKIQSYAFHACANLKDIYFLGEPPKKVNHTAFNLCRDDTLIHYKKGTAGWEDTWCGYKTVGDM
ncbi:MAG: leucine-rich repeat domain-containing protein, partial [Oscillospiraceae bacterium]|nr:leucine-rich repeat domain-containing protein [Oscillospiraceae bacterium]